MLAAAVIFQGQLQAETDSDTTAKMTEIEKLRHDLAREQAEKEIIKARNSELLSRMKQLESRILELRNNALDQNDVATDSEVK